MRLRFVFGLLAISATALAQRPVGTPGLEEARLDPATGSVVTARGTTVINGHTISAGTGLPSQTSNANKVLTTNGTTASWNLLTGTNVNTSFISTYARTILDDLDAASVRSTLGIDRTLFDVKNYGAVGDGSTNDTSAINSAIAAIPSTGGVLYFPSGTYKVTGALTAFTKPVQVQGDGRDQSVITTASGSIVVFTVSYDTCGFHDLRINNTSGTTPTSASRGIKITSSNKITIENVSVVGFYIDVDHQDGVVGKFDGLITADPVLYGLHITNASSANGGDHSISNCTFLSGQYAATAALHLQDVSGVKITNCKVNSGSPNYLTHGIFYEGTGTNGAEDLLISNTSIEGFGASGNGIRITTASTSSLYNVLLSNIELSVVNPATPSGSSVYVNAATTNNIARVSLNNIVALSPSNAATAYSFTGVSQLGFGLNNVQSGYASLKSETNCTDDDIWLLRQENTWLSSQTLTTGSSGNVTWGVNSDVGGASMGVYGSGHSAYGAITGGANYLYGGGSQNTVIMSDGGPIIFAASGNAETSRMTSSAFTLASNVAIAFAGTGAATTRTNLGATTVGANVFALTNPGAITFPKFNADNTVSAESAATHRTSLGLAIGTDVVGLNGALGTPSSGTVTNLTGTASININGTVGATTPAAGTFTTLSASGHVTSEGVTSTGATGTGKFVYDASPTLTGTPLAPTAAAGTNTTQLATTAFVKAATPTSSYRTILQAGCRSTAGQTTNTYIFSTINGSIVASGASLGFAADLVNIAAADFPTVNGGTTTMRIRAELVTNATAPAITFTIGLYPLSSVAGGANINTYTLGTVVSGSTVAFTTPSASTVSTGVSTDFAIPSDGAYAIGVVLSGTTAGNSQEQMTVHLQMKN